MKFASTGLPDASRRAPSTEAKPADGEAGFTLIETLTALTILAIALVSLFEAQATGLRTAGSAAEYAKARILAQSLLAETTAGWRGGALSRRGNDDGFDWTVDIARAPSGPPANADTKWRLHQVRVAVDWGRDRHLQLDTLKLGSSGKAP